MQSTPRNILIIEDHPESQKWFTGLLDHDRFDIQTAATHTQGLEAVHTRSPDIILLALSDNMFRQPEATLDICSQFSDIPIVIITQMEEEQHARTYLQNGIQDILMQTELTVDRLSRELNYAVERKKSQDALQEAIEELRFTNRQLEQMIEDSNQIAVNADIAAIELNQIFNTSADGMWVLSKDFTILKINDAFVNLFGLEREQLIGKSCFEIFQGSLCTPQGCPVVSLLSGKNRVEYDVERKDKDGGKRHFILTATPLKILDGQIIGFVGSYTDITDRRAAEEQLKTANEALKRLSIIDGLTQIANRRKFDEYLMVEWNRLKREKQPLSLILCDIDYFKLFNDSYGHQAGDDCLKAVAGEIQKNAKRPADLAARYGGEEFALILPNTPPQGALHLAETIRKKIQARKIPHKASQVSAHVSLSLGVAGCIPAAEGSPQRLIAQADEALYTAKENGRNRSVLHTMKTNRTPLSS